MPLITVPEAIKSVLALLNTAPQHGPRMCQLSLDFCLGTQKSDPPAREKERSVVDAVAALFQLAAKHALSRQDVQDSLLVLALRVRVEVTVFFHASPESPLCSPSSLHALLTATRNTEVL